MRCGFLGSGVRRIADQSVDWIELDDPSASGDHSLENVSMVKLHPAYR